MKKITYSILVSALALVACNKEKPQVTIPDDQKEKISFSLSDGTTGTKAGFTGAKTRIVARFQSDASGKSSLYTRTYLEAAKDETGAADGFSKVGYVSGNNRYWDDAYGRAATISVYAVAIPNSEEKSKLTDEILAGDGTWKTEATPNNSINWSVTYATTQTSATLAGEDLAYSNNIQTGGINGRYVWSYTAPTGYPADNGKTDGHKDGPLVFTQKEGAQSSDAGHFDKGHLMFKHSLSRLTVVLVPGTGFATERSTAADFKFNKIDGTVTSGNILLLNFPVKGSLNLQSGSWTTDATDGTHDILQMIGAAATSESATPAAAYNATAETYLANCTYSAQMLPGKEFGANSAANVMQFVIDDNTYYITEKMVYDALTADAAGTWYNTNKSNSVVLSAAGYNVGTSVTMTQGHNYTLTITVNKTGIANVTAALAPWVEVAGSTTVNNAHITLSLTTDGSTCDKDIDLYRLIDNNDSYDQDQYVFNYEGKRWFGNYSTDSKYKTTLLQSARSDNKWSTPWYFESNKEYYHFRTVNKETVIKGNTDDTNDYFEITAGPTDTHDPHWGAPMKSTSTTWLKYDENNTLTDYSDDKGYEAHLHHAIGATESQIAIQELHMMSNINVILKTPSDGGKVQLYKPAVLYTYAEYKALDGKSGTTEEQFSALSEADKTKEAAVGTVIKITRLAKDGKVEMGRGVVTPNSPYTDELTMTSPSTESASAYYKTNDTESNTYSYAVVPQSLSRNFDSLDDTDFVGIFIQTPDHNQYYVVKKLSEITATSVSDERNQTKNQAIKRWYPGHAYTYTFTISKKGIENITCSVADWVTVDGGNTNIDLEN